MPSTRHQVDSRLLEPWMYILNVPGKNVRGTLITAFNKWLRVPKERVEEVAEVVRMLHTSSLLIDDIEDDSSLRRGVPVAHSIYGLPSTLNTANYVYVMALAKVMGLGSEEAMRVFVEEMLNLHRGQGQDILWRDTGKCPSEDEYRQMVLDKTGGLFRLAVGLLQAFSEDSTDYTPLLNCLAYYFQVRDDYMNLASTVYHANKSFCEDLTEGKFSFPIIHAINSHLQDNRLVRILKQRTKDVEVKKYAVGWMRECGSLDYTRNKIRELKAECLAIIDSLHGHETLVQLIENLDRQIDEASSPRSSSIVFHQIHQDTSHLPPLDATGRLSPKPQQNSTDATQRQDVSMPAPAVTISEPSTQEDVSMTSQQVFSHPPAPVRFDSL